MGISWRFLLDNIVADKEAVIQNRYSLRANLHQLNVQWMKPQKKEYEFRLVKVLHQYLKLFFTNTFHLQQLF